MGQSCRQERIAWDGQLQFSLEKRLRGVGSQRSFLVQYPALFPAPFFRSFPIAQLLSALSPLSNHLALIPLLSLQHPSISSLLPACSLSFPQVEIQGPIISTEHPGEKYAETLGKAIMNGKLAEMRKGAGWGTEEMMERTFISRSTVFKVPLSPHIPSKKLQGEVLSSLGQGSPASHSWLLLQLAPRSSRTPV